MNDKIGLSTGFRSPSATEPTSSNPARSLTEPEYENWIEAAIGRYESPLLRYAKHFVGDLETARDIVQDTFLQLCRQSEEELKNRLGQWLYTVCRNRAIDVIRKESRMERVSDRRRDAEERNSDRISDPADTQLGPRATLELAEDTSGLLEQIQRLPDRQQEVLRLKFHGGLSYKEIAEVMDITSSNVGFILHSAITKLRQRMVKTT